MAGHSGRLQLWEQLFRHHLAEFQFQPPLQDPFGTFGSGKWKAGLGGSSSVLKKNKRNIIYTPEVSVVVLMRQLSARGRHISVFPKMGADGGCVLSVSCFA